MRKSLSLAGLLLFAVVLAAHGDDPPANPPAAAPPPAEQKKANKKDKLPLATPEREAAALMFVQMNHPELAEVLTQLKSTRPAEYDKAIRELFKACEQLNKTRDNDPRKFDLDLEAWKVKSRIQLLAARASLSDDPALEQQLRQAVNRQAEIRLEQLALQREQLVQKLAKLDDQLAAARADNASQAEKQYSVLMRGVSKARAAAAKKNKPAVEKPSEPPKEQSANK